MRHLLLACLALPLAAAEPFFRAGDRPIVFLGDSITEQARWTTPIETWLLVRHPQWKLSFRHIGWSGDSATMWQRGGTEAGVTRDVLPLKPGILLVDYGMNDARGGEPGLPGFTRGLTTIVERSRAIGARVALISPSPEEREQPGQPAGSAYNHMLARFASAAESVATTAGIPYVDQLAPFIAVIEAGRAAGVLGGDERLIPDAVHPDQAGGLIMAAAVLRGLGEMPNLTRIEVDAAAGTVTAEGCEAVIDSGATPGITLRVSDHSLPWPVSSEARAAFGLPASPAAGLEKHRLIVRGLPAGRYQLQVDGRDRIVRTAAELEAGIERTALRADDEQAGRLLAAVEAKNQVFFRRWRQVQLFAIPSWLSSAGDDAKRDAELARLDAEIAAAEAAIEPLRQTKPYRLTIAPAAPSRPIALTATTADGGVDLAWRLLDGDAVASVIERASGTGAFAEVARVPAPATTYRDATPVDAARYRVRALGAKALSSPSLAAAPGAAAGFAAAYFRGTELLGSPVLERIDPTIATTWQEAEAPLGPSDFSARWSALLTPASGGPTVLYATSDDGVRIWIDGALELDEWRGQAPTEFSLRLPERPVEVVIEYYQGAGGATTRLEWKPPGQPRVVVPSTAVRPLFASAP